MSLVDELAARAVEKPGHWIARVVRNRPSMAWDALLREVTDRERARSRWEDDGGSCCEVAP